MKSILEFDNNNNRPAENGIDIYFLDTPISCSFNSQTNILTLSPEHIIDPHGD